MSEKKNGLEFDNELLSSLENLKRKYASYDDLEMDIQTNTPKEEPAPVEYEIESVENEPAVQQNAEYEFSDSIKNKDDSDAENDTDFAFSEAKEDEPESNDIYSYSSAEELQDDEDFLSEDDYIYSDVSAENEDDDEFADLDDEEEDKLFSGSFVQLFIKLFFGGDEDGKV